MKIWEIELEEGRKYKSNKGHYYIVCSDMLLLEDSPSDITEFYILKDLLELDFEETFDWSKIEKDTPVLVRNSENNSWILRHFDSFEVSPSGRSKIYKVFKGGRTSFTIQQLNQGERKYEYYSQIKLYKEEK